LSMVRKGSPVRVRKRASSDLPAQAGILFLEPLERRPSRGLGGVCGAPALLVVPQLRPAEYAGGQIHATCDISVEEPMPHHPHTGCPNEEEPQETPAQRRVGTLVVRLPCPAPNRQEYHPDDSDDPPHRGCNR